MTPRQRFRETLLFGNPDKIPLQPGGPRESTLAAWHQQGLPEEVDYYEYLMQILKIDPEPTDGHIAPGVSFQMIPTFEEKVIEHRDGHYIVQDWMGAITEISDEFDYTYIRSAKDFVTRKWHKFPVESREDWEEMKKRFNPETPGRFPADFEERCQKLKNRDYVAGIHFNGPFWQLREWLGMENLCMMLLDDPEFVREMVDFWVDFLSRTIAPILEHIELDRVGISEDMAYKIHSMISPAMTRHFLQPAYKRWVKEVKASGCPIIDMDSDGYIGELIPIWIESGINVCDPIEVAAGNDIVEFRKQFGRKMGYTGAIDKRALAKGGKVMRDEVLRVVPRIWVEEDSNVCDPIEVAAGNDIVEFRKQFGRKMGYTGAIDKRALAKGGKVMRAEVLRVVPPLLKEGGFIPGCDHGVPPDISWPNFVEYSRLLAELCGWL